MTAAATGSPAADCRCLCGNLLARWVEDGVELKCRRCKRTLLVPFPDAPARIVTPTRSRPIPVCEVG